MRTAHQAQAMAKPNLQEASCAESDTRGLKNDQHHRD